MMKKYKWSLLLGSLVTLLPIPVGICLWDHLPEAIPVHWGINGKADGTATPWIVVFLLPLLLLALHWLCVWITFRDPKSAKQNPKAMNLAFWMVPLCSLFSCGIIFAAGLGTDFNLFRLVLLFIAIIFLVVGNYMPKVTRNSYLGIKVPWTLYNEENWNATHRFCGKVWVLCGLVTLAGVFLPETFIIPLLLIPLIALVLSCTLYSYLYYRKQVKAGLPPIPKKPLTKKRMLSLLAVILLILLLGALFGYLMFTGDIRLHYGQDSFTIEADFHSDFTADYEAITSVEYSRHLEPGTRVSGFHSPRLLMGTFRNKELGNYTLYTYTGSEDWVVLRNGDRILVLGGKTPEDTLEIYETLKEKIQ